MRIRKIWKKWASTKDAEYSTPPKEVANVTCGCVDLMRLQSELALVLVVSVRILKVSTQKSDSNTQKLLLVTLYW